MAGFGTSVGSLLGLPQGFRGLSWTFLSLVGPLLGCPRACLSCSRPYFRGSWAALGLPFAALLAQDAARQQQSAPRWTQKSPKNPKTDPPKNNLFVYFLGSVFGPFSALPVGGFLGFLDAWPLKVDDFAWDILQKCWFSPDVPRAKKAINNN